MNLFKTDGTYIYRFGGREVCSVRPALQTVAAWGGQHATDFALSCLRHPANMAASRQPLSPVQLKDRITKEEALSFLLTHIVVEQNTPVHLDQLSLFNLNNLAQQAIQEINQGEGVIPHEVIESLAREYLSS